MLSLNKQTWIWHRNTILPTHSCQNIGYHAAEDICQPKVTAVMPVGESLVIGAQQVQDRGVQVVQMDPFVVRYWRMYNSVGIYYR